MELHKTLGLPDPVCKKELEEFESQIETMLRVAGIKDKHYRMYSFAEIVENLIEKLFYNGYDLDETVEILLPVLETFPENWTEDLDSKITINELQIFEMLSPITPIRINWFTGEFLIQVETINQWFHIHNKTISVFERLFVNFWIYEIEINKGKDDQDKQQFSRTIRSRMLKMIKKAKDQEEITDVVVLRLHNAVDLLIPRMIDPENSLSVKPVYTVINL